MHYRRLGRTGLSVSQLGLGTVELGLKYGIGKHTSPPSEAEAVALLHFALDSGINLIDTARTYGASESIIGKALKGRRQEYILVSKVQPHPGNSLIVQTLVEESLRDLQTDNVDVMMLHCRADESAPDPDSIDALQRLREAGKVRFIGTSVYGSSAALAAIRDGAFDCLEIAYNALDRRSEGGVLDSAKEKDIGILARSVLLKGALTERFHSLPAELNALKAAVEQLVELAGGPHELPRFAYRYVLSREPPHSALVGTASRAELQACIAYTAEGPLPRSAIEAAERIEVGDEVILNPGHWPTTA